MIGFSETKIKKKNVDKTAARNFSTWRWQHNVDLNPKGHTWIASNTSMYLVDVLQVNEQLVHCKVLQIHTLKSFFITFIYSFNQEQQR